METNPYTPPTARLDEQSIKQGERHHRGPLLYLAIGGLLGGAAAIPLVITPPLSANPNPIGYLFILLGVPVGGIIYRFRSQHWPIDHSARKRQIRAALATLLLPGAIALFTGMRAQGFAMALVAGLVSLSVVLGIFAAGRRRA